MIKLIGYLFQASRAQILNKATEYIQLMTKKNSTFKCDIDELTRQNTELEKKIQHLETAKKQHVLVATNNSSSNNSCQPDNSKTSTQESS